jgi:hypothetical protein
MEAFDELNRLSPGWEKRSGMISKYPSYNEKE